MKSLAKFEVWIIILAMIFPTILTYIYFVHLAGTASSLQQIAYSVGKTLQFALPVLWVGIVCRERWLIRQFQFKQGVTDGIFFGVIVFLSMLFLYVSWLALPGAPLGPESSARQAILDKISGLGLGLSGLLVVGLFYSVIHSGLEEYYWRWFVFGRLQRFMPRLWSALISSLGFMAHHVILLGTYFGYNSVYCWLGSAAVAIGGFIWAGQYKRSDSIWGPWIGHGLVDAAIFSIGYMIVYNAG